jgi:hypothetical protein
MDSILISVKKLLGIDETYTQFDPDIILNINSVLMSLNQLGIGPTTGFMITGNLESWSSILGDRQDIESVKLYVFLKVRLVFDPPTNAFLVEAMERQIRELEWRINAQAESITATEETTTTVEGGTVSE